MKIWKTMETLLIAALLMGCPPSPGNNTHTVTFESNSGSAVASQEVAEGDHATQPTPPTRSGHAFDGWYSDSGLSNAWTFGSDTVNSDITLYAKWMIAHTVIFDSNSGSAVVSQQVAGGYHATEPTAPTRSGHAFDGWYSDSGLSNAWTFGSDTVNKDMTLYAKWELVYHTVTFDSNSGSAVASRQVAEGGHAPEPKAPTKSDYAFYGWYSDSSLSDVWTFGSDTVNSDITLYAKWVAPKIGDSGPAGGKVFYDKGSYSDGWRYLEAAPSDQGKVEWGGYTWGGTPTTVGGTDTTIGSGKSNTEKIVTALGTGNYAARLCYDLEFGGYDDWFLPSNEELYELYRQKDTVGGFATGGYWSSSEYDSEEAYVQFFNNGNRDDTYKGIDYSVRAVRAF